MPNISRAIGSAVGRFLGGGLKKLPGASRTLIKSAKELSKTTATRISQQTSGVGTTTTRQAFGGQLPPGLSKHHIGTFKVAWGRSLLARGIGGPKMEAAFMKGMEGYTRQSIKLGAQKGVTGISYETLTGQQLSRLVSGEVYNFSEAGAAGSRAVGGAMWRGAKGWMSRNTQPIGPQGRALRFVGGGIGKGLGWTARTTLTDPGAKGRNMRRVLYTGAIFGGGVYGATNTINSMRHQYSNSGMAPSKVAIQSVVSGPGYNSWMKMPGRGMSPNNLNTAGLTLALNSKRHSR